MRETEDLAGAFRKITVPLPYSLTKVIGNWCVMMSWTGDNCELRWQLPLEFFFFFMNGNTQRAHCALSLVCIPKEKDKEVNVK